MDSLSKKVLSILTEEHKTILKGIDLIEREGKKDINDLQIDPYFLSQILDFMQTYADRCHHGKEENILFSALQKKELSPPMKIILNELLQEHIKARSLISSLKEAVFLYRQNDHTVFSFIVQRLIEITDLYKKHIEKENKHFFVPSIEYFSKEELEDILEKFYEFDRKMIHEKYQKVIRDLSDA